MAAKVISVVLNAIVGPYQAAMARASATTQAFGTQAAMAGKGAMTMGGQVTGLSSKLVGGAGLAYGLKEVVGSAMEFESSFAGVRKTVDATEDEFASLSSGFREMAKQIPVNVNELNRIGEAAGQLGIETDNILDFTRVMADLGVATNMSSEQAATSLARLANITQMPQTEFSRLGSTVVALGNNLATTEAEVVEMGMRLAGAGAQVGMTEHQILGLAGALTEVGINAEAGGSALSKVMIEIASEVENGGDKLETFARVAGMTADQFATQWRDDATGALTAFITGLGNMEGQGQSTLQVLEELGITEVRMRDALLRTSGAGDNLTRALGLANEAWTENNALTKEAEQRYATTESKVQIAKNAFNDLKIELGEGLLPVLGDVADGLADFMGAEVEVKGVTIGLGDVIQGALAIPMGDAGFWTRHATEELEDNERAVEANRRKALEAKDTWLAGIAVVEDLTEAFEEQTEAVEENVLTLAEHHEMSMRSFDPVMNLTGALRDVSEAQEAYTDAVEEHGPASAEAADAAEELAHKVASAEAAALNGDLKFDEFNETLQRWVRSGHITAEQADLIAERVANARGEAELYEGEYVARVVADTAEAERRLASLHSSIGRLPTSITIRSHLIGATTAGALIPRGPGVERRAAGGPVEAGRLYQVNELGTEYFMPAVGGEVIPLGGNASGGNIDQMKMHRDIRRIREAMERQARQPLVTAQRATEMVHG